MSLFCDHGLQVKKNILRSGKEESNKNSILRISDRVFFRILFAFTDIRITVRRIAVTLFRDEPVGLPLLVIHSNKHYFLKVNVCFLSQYYKGKYYVEFVWIKQFLLKQQL